MTYRLMNAAVMPVDGTYELRKLAITTFITMVREENPISYIGYPECRDFLERICGVPIAINRESTPMEDGDRMLIARLKYRVGNPVAKGQVKAKPDDYEFFFCRFTVHKTTQVADEMHFFDQPSHQQKGAFQCPKKQNG